MREFCYEKVRDPEYFQENRLPAHSDHVCYASRQERERGYSTFRHSLNGLWKFSYAPSWAGALKDFESPDVDCRGWADIRVPAHIQMEGYDTPQYVNVQYPWDGREEIRPGEIPERFNPVASYVKYFTLPREMQGKPLYISFQGVESGMALYLNGFFVGYSEDTFTPSEFELTPYVREGENKLAVRVFKWTSSSWCEDQDFFRFSGIFREVYLYTCPETHIWDVKVRTLLEESLEQACLSVVLKAQGEGSARLVLSREGQEAARLECALGKETELRMPVEKPLLWSAETPWLYDLDIEVKTPSGETAEVIRQRVGFRRFEIKNSLMLLNGKRIVFRGVNRHEFSSRSGRAVSREELWQDLVTMKQNNINAIRTSHYPNSSALYGLCDELGLYLIDETNLESHGNWGAAAWGGAPLSTVVPGDNPKWRGMVLDRANSMYQRDKNHPSILLWSCGNESFGGRNIYEMSEFFRSKDDRPVHYEGIFHDRRYPDTSDVESQMYTPAEGIRQFLKEHRDKPFICCEYSHAMGNSCGAMHKYTDLTEEEPLYQGGFIWDYIDQSLERRNRFGESYQAYGGDFGDRPNDGNFSGNGIVYGGRTPSPKMQEVKYNYQSIRVEVREDSVKVTNRNLFVNTDQFACEALLEKEGRLLRRESMQTAAAPGESAVYPLPFAVPGEPGEYAVTVSFRLREAQPWAPAGHETAFGQAVFRRTGTKGQCALGQIALGQAALGQAALGQAALGQAALGQNALGQIALGQFSRGAGLPVSSLPVGDWPEGSLPLPVGSPQIIRGDSNLGVRGDGFEILFSYGSGPVSYRFGGKELLEAVPRPNFWRAPTDNDRGNGMPARCGQWKLASLYQTTQGVKGKNPLVEEGEGWVRITYTYRLGTFPESFCRAAYQVWGDGTVEATLRCQAQPAFGEMPEFGLLFQMSADYDRLEWYGDGPQETYSDRRRGAKLGLYRNLVRENMAAYLKPQECGNKTGVRWAKVTDSRGRGMLFAGEEMSFSALPYTPHELEAAAHSYELPPVHHTIVRCQLAQMGVGGDDSWGARTHPEYLLPDQGELEFRFSFRGI